MTTTITFRTPLALMSMNDRLHWSARARLARSWRHTAYLYTRNAINSGAITWTPTPAEVQLVLPVPDARRRDPHNYFATVKPVIDGLVDAGLWPDDTPEWVTTTEPTLRVTNLDRLVTILITPRPVA